jgi:hypothetical protein
MAHKQEGVKAPFRIKKITVIQQSGTDEVRIDTDLPLGVYPYEGYPQVLRLEVSKGMGVEYVRKNFNIEPEVIKV